jgi:hypothetical protein
MSITAHIRWERRYSSGQHLILVSIEYVEVINRYRGVVHYDGDHHVGGG